MITRIGTYLPIWSGHVGRRTGPDEDAVTLVVESGRAALAETSAADVRLVVFVTRDLPLMEGGNAAALLAGLDGLGVSALTARTLNGSSIRRRPRDGRTGDVTSLVRGQEGRARHPADLLDTLTGCHAINGG